MLNSDTSESFINEHGIIKRKSALTHVTEEEDALPDPDGIKMLNQFILVRPVSLTDKIRLASGLELFLPDTAKEDRQMLVAVGRVINMGDFACKRPEVSKLNVGDYVLFPKHAGERSVFNGVKCVIMYDDTPLAIVDKEKLKI